MKKNLAKKVTLSILAGAMLMTSSVAWADGYVYMAGNDASSTATGDRGIAVGYNSAANGKNSIAIGANPSLEGSFTRAGGVGSISIGVNSNAYGDSSIAIGTGSDIDSKGSVAIGANAKVTTGLHSVALGSGSIADVSDVVSVGHGGNGSIGSKYRKIVNVENGSISADSHDAVTGGQLYDISVKIGDGDFSGTGVIRQETTTLTGAISEVSITAKANQDKIGSTDFTYNTTYITNSEDLTDAAKDLDAQVKINADAIANKANASDVYTKAQADSTFVKISNNANDAPTSGFNVVNTNNITKVSVTHVGGDNPVVISSDDGITVGEHSTRMDGSGFYVWDKNDTSNHNPEKSIASIKDDGSIKGAGGAFTVDASGNVTAEKITANKVTADNLYTKDEIDQKLGGSNASVAGLSQRLDKTNAKINKVGAGAAALAALHPLEYDPDDKLTFSAGMGNYAGENAAALGAFYRPNEKFMVSLGDTMGNGENMVNLGLSIGLDKPNGYAKLSKRELIQKVNAMEAKYEAVEAEKEAMKAEMAEMKAMLQAILAKK